MLLLSLFDDVIFFSLIEKTATKTFWKIQSDVSPVFLSFVGQTWFRVAGLGAILRTAGRLGHAWLAFIGAELMETRCLAGRGAHSNPRRGILTQYGYCAFTFTSLFLSGPDCILLGVGQHVTFSR